MKVLVLIGHRAHYYGRRGCIELVHIRLDEDKKPIIDAVDSTPEGYIGSLKDQIDTMPPILYDKIYRTRDDDGYTYLARLIIGPSESSTLEAIANYLLLPAGESIAGYTVHSGESKIVEQDELPARNDHTGKKLVIFGYRSLKPLSCNIVAEIWYDGYKLRFSSQKYPSLAKTIEKIVMERLADNPNTYSWESWESIKSWPFVKVTREPVTPGDQFFLDALLEDPFLWIVYGVRRIDDFRLAKKMSRVVSVDQNPVWWRGHDRDDRYKPKDTV